MIARKQSKIPSIYPNRCAQHRRCRNSVAIARQLSKTGDTASMLVIELDQRINQCI